MSSEAESSAAGYAFYGHQSISEQDIANVVQVLKSDWLTQGPTIREFEQAMCARFGARYAVAVSSATAALHLACIALDLKPGSRLWTSPNTFVASANCARYCGADVDFVDIDSDTFNMSVAALAAKLEIAHRKGSMPDVVVPVHFGGLPCDMAAIGALAERYGFHVVEDASHAVGSSYRGQMTGACNHSDLVVFSFHPVKVMTTAEGGMLLTNDKALWERLCLLRSHGTTRNQQQMQGESHGAWYYEQLTLGYNYRMTDVHAALGLSQLAQLERFLAYRRRLVERYDEVLADLAVRPQGRPVGLASAHHLYAVRLLEQAPSRRVVFDRLRGAGVGVNVHYIPVHMQPYYHALGFKSGDFPEAEKYYTSALSLPLHVGLSDADQDYVVAALRRALS